MATNYTEQFQLNLWESGDAFRREEFNQDNQKLENALKSHAAALEVHNGQITALEQVQTAQSQTLNALSSQKASVYVGTYEGNNASLTAVWHTQICHVPWMEALLPLQL